MSIPQTSSVSAMTETIPVARSARGDASRPGRGITSSTFREEVNSAATSVQRTGRSVAVEARRTESGNRANGKAAEAQQNAGASSPAASGGPFMMPMQQSWTAPVITPQASAYPIHPVYGVPMVSEATLNRYLHPLQSIDAVPPNQVASAGDLATTVYRVAPGGLQDFVTSDGYRHRFDVEVVFPSPESVTWQERDAGALHPEVGEFAAEQLRSSLEAAGIDTEGLEIEPFRMKGGNPSRPWFLDQLVLHKPGEEDLPVSLNVAMRDPAYTIETIRALWAEQMLPS